MPPSHLPCLCARKHDIVQAHDPINDGKGGRNEGADQVRHHRRSTKSSFGFLGLLLRISGIVESDHFFVQFVLIIFSSMWNLN